MQTGGGITFYWQQKRLRILPDPPRDPIIRGQMLSILTLRFLSVFARA
jgi:hypothetical protein